MTMWNLCHILADSQARAFVSLCKLDLRQHGKVEVALKLCRATEKLTFNHNRVWMGLRSVGFDLLGCQMEMNDNAVWLGGN
jgi:hypothetical protein